MFNSFRWYRKWRGGTWYYNRYRLDVDTIFVWERKNYGRTESPYLVTLKSETY